MYRRVVGEPGERSSAMAHRSSGTVPEDSGEIRMAAEIAGHTLLDQRASSWLGMDTEDKVGPGIVDMAGLAHRGGLVGMAELEVVGIVDTGPPVGVPQSKCPRCIAAAK